MSSNKLDILIETFELIKYDIDNDNEAIARVLTQIQAINPQKAIELWHDLIKSNEHYMATDFRSYGPSYYMTGWMYTQLAEHDDFLNAEEHFLNDEWLLDKVFRCSPNFLYSIMKTADSLLKQHRFDEADKIFNLILQNAAALRQTSLYELLDFEFNHRLRKHGSYYDRLTWGESRTFAEDVIEMFKRWINNIEGKKERMKLLSSILDFIEE